MDANSVQREVDALEKKVGEEAHELGRQREELRKREAEATREKQIFDKAEADLSSMKAAVTHSEQQRQENEKKLRTLADGLKKAIDLKK